MGRRLKVIESVDFWKQTTNLALAGILGPIVGLVGAKLKTMFEKRDARAESAHLLSETTRLLRFHQNLGLSVSPTAERARVVLDTAIEKNLDAIMHCYSGATAVQRKTERTPLERIFLLYRPHRFWQWLLHVIYFGFLGVIVLGALMTMSEGRAKLSGNIGALVFFIVCAALWNLLTNWVDKRTKPTVAAKNEGPASLSQAAGK